MTIFINALGEKDKEKAVMAASKAFKSSAGCDLLFQKSEIEICKIPGAPFAYWVNDKVTQLYEGELFNNEKEGRGTRCGLGTLDDFRFIRTFWEVGPGSSRWVTYFHGGVFQRFYDNFYLLVNWGRRGSEVKSFVESKVGSVSRKVQGEDKYFKPGFVFPRRTKAFSPKFMPGGGIYSTGGQAGFTPSSELISTVGILASKPVNFLISLSQGRTGDAAQFEVGLVKRLPWPEIDGFKDQVESLSLMAWSRLRAIDLSNECSLAFMLPAFIRRDKFGFDPKSLLHEVEECQRKIDEIGFSVYGLRDEDCNFANESKVLISSGEGGSAAGGEGNDEFFSDALDHEVASLKSWCIGVAFGRFDWRLATGEREVSPEPEPFDPLPAKSPGMLPDGAEPYHRHAGILVDDAGHEHDLPRLMSDVLETVDAQVDEDLRRWLRRDFFKYHLQQYSKSRRKAPIYWPLATASGSYTLWLYYPDLTDQTLFTAVNDFVEPKLKQVDSELGNLRLAGSSRSRADEKRIEELSDFRDELADLRDILLRIAPDYKPSHDDGVQITAAPLWPLFRLKPWQKVLKETWEKLEQGDYDWAHLAMAYWPERVRERCVTDKSLAIAHDLEHLYVEPEPVPKKSRGRKKSTGSGE